MKKTKIIASLALMGLGMTTLSYGADKNSTSSEKNALSPVGYWVQFDEDNDAGRGKIQGIIQTYFAKNSDHGTKGTLEMKIAVPVMKIDDSGKMVPAPIHCDVCGKGEINGFKYNYTDNDTNFMQGLVFTGNLQPQTNTAEKGSKSTMYDLGGVLNPNDGKTYNSQAQVQDGGKTMFARAYKGSGWYSVGKNAHWKRISKDQYKEFKKLCGFDVEENKPNHSAFLDNDGKLVDQKLFKQCYDYNFGVAKPV